MLHLLIEESGLQIDVRPQLGHYLGEHRRRQRLRAVRPGLLRARVYFNDQPIGADGYRRFRRRTNETPPAGCVGGIDYDGKMAEFVQQRDGCEVQGVARGSFEGSNAALTQDDLIVSVRRDVLGR